MVDEPVATGRNNLPFMVAAPSMNQIYHRTVSGVEHEGDHYIPRGHECIEVRPAIMTIDDCRQGLYTGMSRRLNYAFLAAETLCYIAGWGETGQVKTAGLGEKHAKLMVKLNKNMAGFVNEAGYFDGAYGPRLVQSLPAVVQLLKRDPFSRQAIAAIWYPGLLNHFRHSKDVPCTVDLHFFAQPLQGGTVADPAGLKLSMTAHMRSNDLNWGTPYDVAAFCAIQALVADAVDMVPGIYQHFAGSLHFYAKTPPRLDHPSLEDWLLGFRIPTLGFSGFTIEDVIRQANTFLEELYTWIVECDQDRSDFVCGLEVLDTPFADYWKQWGDMVRFKWGPVSE